MLATQNNSGQVPHVPRWSPLDAVAISRCIDTQSNSLIASAVRHALTPPSPLPRAGEGCRRRGEGLMARQDTIGYHCLSGLQSRTSCTRPGGTSNCPELDANTREQCGTPKAAEVEVLIEVVCNAPFAVRRPEH